MKTFENTLNKRVTFSSCNICDAKCCDGARGTTFSQLILQDFEEVYKNFPIVFLLGDLGYLKPVVLLTNGSDYCRYLKDNRCSIYDNRPSVCRIYPLSPHLTNTIFVDTLCPAVNGDGEVMVNDGIVKKDFKHSVLDDYQDKYIQMHLHFEKYNNKENLEVITKIGTDYFYKFKEDFGDDYLKLHLSSLKSFDTYFKS